MSEKKNFPAHIVAVGGLVYNKDGKVLIAKDRLRETYTFLGGQVENGENLEEALIREIMEESGITASVRCLVGVYSNISQYTWYDGVTHVPTKLMLDFICDYTAGEPRISDETSEVLWVTPEEAAELITHPVYALKLRNMLAFDGAVFYVAW